MVEKGSGTLAGSSSSRKCSGQAIQPLQSGLDVGLGGSGIYGASPQYCATPKYCRGDQRESIFQKRLDQLQMERIIARRIAEADDGHCGLSNDFPSWHLTQATLGERGQCEAAFDGAAKGCHAENLDRHPELKRTKGSGQLQAVVGEIEFFRILVGILQVIRQDAERIAQLSQVADQNATDFERLKKPLVGIERKRVGLFHAAK